MGFLLPLVGEYGLEQTLKNKERKRTPSSPAHTCQPLSSGTEQNSFLSSTSHQWKVWVVLKGLAFQAWKKKKKGTNHNSMVFQRQLLSMGLFCVVNTEFYQFEPIIFQPGMFLHLHLVIWFLWPQPAGQRPPPPRSVLALALEVWQVWQVWQCVQVDPSGSGGDVTQELQLSSLSIHSPRRGTLSTFLGQFKARAGEIQVAPHSSPQAVA